MNTPERQINPPHYNPYCEKCSICDKPLYEGDYCMKTDTGEIVCQACCDSGLCWGNCEWCTSIAVEDW